jgi:hypothetical protein
MSRTDRLPEYPRAERQALEERAIREFNAHVDEHGRGKHWLADEPRAHVFKAVDELFLARGAEHNGDRKRMQRHFENALNHILFAMEITDSDTTTHTTATDQEAER